MIMIRSKSCQREMTQNRNIVSLMKRMKKSLAKKIRKKKMKKALMMKIRKKKENKKLNIAKEAEDLQEFQKYASQQEEEYPVSKDTLKWLRS